jgi:hypothetical protein
VIRRLSAPYRGAPIRAPFGWARQEACGFDRSGVPLIRLIGRADHPAEVTGSVLFPLILVNVEHIVIDHGCGFDRPALCTADPQNRPPREQPRTLPFVQHLANIRRRPASGGVVQARDAFIKTAQLSVLADCQFIGKCCATAMKLARAPRYKRRNVHLCDAKQSMRSCRKP